MKKDNPYTLTYGVKPSTYIARDYETADEIISAFEGKTPLSNTCLITGPRGSGKTSLMMEVSDKLKKSKDWVVVDLNASQPLFSEFTTRVVDASVMRIHILTLAYVAILDYFGYGYSEGVGKMEFVLEQLSAQGKRILITIDEAAADENMYELASQFQMFARKGFKIFLMMTALFDDVYKLQDGSIPLSLRALKVILGNLNIDKVKEQYKEKLGVDDELAVKMAEYTKGYPFAVQAFGALYWEYNDRKSYDEIVELTDEILEEYAYGTIWMEMPDMEKKIVKALPADGSAISVEELCGKLEMDASTYKSFGRRLVYKGILTSPDDGYTSIALPHFGKITEEYEICTGQGKD